MYGADQGGRSVGVAAVGPSTFEGCSALAEVTLPSSVASIADKAFSGCAALSEIALGNVKSIGDEAFAAGGLTEVSLGGATLGAKAFRDCPALAAVELGSIGTVPAESFKGCTSLTSLTVPASVTAVDAGCVRGLFEARRPFTGQRRDDRRRQGVRRLPA